MNSSYNNGQRYPQNNQGLINSNSQKPIAQPQVNQSNFIQYSNQNDLNNSGEISPEKLIKKYERDYDDVYRLNVEEINRELDNNMNEVIILLNRRKALISHKRKKIREEFYQRQEEIKRMSPEQLSQEIMRSSYDEKALQNIVMNTQNVSRMQKIVNTVTRDINTNTQVKQKQEMSKSGDFWNANKSFESEIDNLLKKLKYLDGELEVSHKEIHENCRSLDQIEDSIRDLLVTKKEDHVKRAEPLFNQKQKQLEMLKDQTGNRNKIKDEKIQLIHKIIDMLSNLQNLRDQRLSDLSNVFGIDENAESNVKISYYIDFVDQLENLAKVKENLYELEQQEEPLDIELDRAYRDNDQIFQELIRRQSEEARIFAEFSDNQRKRLQMQRAVEYFLTHANLNQLQNLDIKDILNKFKDNIIFLKPLVEEDVAIRAGLQKTGETISTFQNILNANKLEKERRKELLVHLENCYRLKREGDYKQDTIRQLELELSKKYQQKSHLDEEIENYIGDADLDQYKKFDQYLKSHDQEINMLKNQKSQYKKEVDDISLEVINQMGIIKSDYEDIIREVAPANLMSTYDFQKANDIKHVQNYLKKTFKRLGLHYDEPSGMQSKQSSQFLSQNQHY
ncbi:hypothetical protein PPERSA_13181 [Pseudocohnilembus persalinus]|uniref:Uncharacterized protein n=1 Tax=Pseudocohnilembus persalinus TaxID=266149 RepID=A0A0V0QKV7_PSEPJ|nr:hypothetical protein PPERSA_13181 [Pseudocohnilembus persalinus]|eukprot:KRX02927.1 hypothetical protein PPERSA_13181 [Pseudocohnilembus persalinus]